MTKTQDELLAAVERLTGLAGSLTGDFDAVTLPVTLANQYASDLRLILAALRSPDPEVERLRAEQIAWRGDSPPQDGSTIYGHSWSPYRWLAYKPSSEQARRGIKGRWQTMNEFGGWENAEAPNEWATQAQIDARAALSSNSGGR